MSGWLRAKEPEEAPLDKLSPEEILKELQDANDEKAEVEALVGGRWEDWWLYWAWKWFFIGFRVKEGVVIIFFGVVFIARKRGYG